VAAATFTFDARELTVWLDIPRDGAARAGDLCDRHATALTAPRGWRVDDRRDETQAEATQEPKPESTSGDETQAEATQEPKPESTSGVGAARESEQAGPPDAMTFDALMHPQTPLLARAFEAAGR
jgi:hypothetical protein